MGVHIRRTPKGLEAKTIGTASWHLISDTFRFAHERRFSVKHFISMEKNCAIYAFDGIAMLMLDNHEADSTVFSSNGRGRTKSSKPVYYPGKAFLVFPSLTNASACKLLDHEGKSLAGSNVHGPPRTIQRDYLGNLCLPSQFTPMDMSPVDALIYDKANAHLDWKGPDLQGRWELMKQGSKSKIFHIQTWPTWTETLYPIPQEILDASGHS